MDKIDQIYLDRIQHPRKVMYWCNYEWTWVDMTQCGKCFSLDQEGHCDYQEGPEEVQT